MTSAHEILPGNSERAPPSYRDLRRMIAELLPVACDGVEARDRDKASNANDGQQSIEKARAMLARCKVQS